MDSLSVSRLNRLFWLGRYYERLSTTLSYLWDWYDVMIDGEIDYPGFCRKLNIDCCYEDDKDFMQIMCLIKTIPIRCARWRMPCWATAWCCAM